MHVHLIVQYRETEPELRKVRSMQNTVHNGMSAELLPGATWRKSTYSGVQGNCVEVAALADGGFAVRNSRFPEGPALIFTAAEMTAFVAGAKDGEFDGMVAGLLGGTAGGLGPGGADLSDPENRGARRVTAIAPGGPN